MAQRRAKRNSGEASLQKVFFQWLAVAHPYAYALCFAIPNGGARAASTGAELKRQGTKKGVPDLMLAIPNDEYAGLFIEFKYGTNKATVEQEVFIARLMEAGYYATICYGFDDAKALVEFYLRDTDYLGRF